MKFSKNLVSKRLTKGIFLLGISALVYSCATYYQKNSQFNQDFETGNISQAQEDLASTTNMDSGKDRFLYFVNYGVVSSILGDYEKSNEYLAQAYRYTQDFRTSVTDAGLSLLVNPMMSQYKPEDHEVLLIHYYSAMNYVMLNDYEEALVECRQLDIALKQLSDKYKSQNKFQADAFVNVLSGLIYDATKDYNNAFISYRNALEIYQRDYGRMFGVSAPDQLKEDILRTAYLTGLTTELDQYEREFDMKYNPKGPGTGDLVFIWNNGLGPVKAELGITFTIIRGSGGAVTFENSDLGLSFPFFLNSGGGDGLGDLEFVRVVFPKYVERPLMFADAELVIGKDRHPLQLVEDVNKISFKTLEERMLLELGESLLRVAIKKSEEYAVRNQSEGWGAVVGALNAMTEKADTRNWQTMPHSIYYARVSLPPGSQPVQLQYANSTEQESFTFDVEANSTTFHSFHTIATAPYNYNF